VILKVESKGRSFVIRRRNRASIDTLLLHVSGQEGLRTMNSEKTVVLAIVLTGLTTLSPARAADATGCTPQARSNQTLSEKLDQSKGVICPPDIDTGIKAPTPDAGKTPVIPPPGSPGGNPNVQPK
jgi:hypothetical protein